MFKFKKVVSFLNVFFFFYENIFGQCGRIWDEVKNKFLSHLVPISICVSCQFVEQLDTIGHSTVWILGSTQNNWASRIDFSLKWRHRKKVISPALVFLGWSPPSLILTTCTAADSPRIHLFLALMRNGNSVWAPLCCWRPAVRHPIWSPPHPQWGDKGSASFCKGRSIARSLSLSLPPPLPSFVSLCSQAPTLGFLFLNMEKHKKKSHYGDRIFMVQPGCLIWLARPRCSVKKSLTCTHSEKSAAQPAGPSGRCAEERLDVVVVKVLGLFHNIFHNLYTV